MRRHNQNASLHNSLTAADCTLQVTTPDDMSLAERFLSERQLVALAA